MLFLHPFLPNFVAQNLNEDLWHWFKRYTTPISGTCLCNEELTDEDVREIMDIIHKGNPRSTKSRRPRTVGSTLSWRIKSNNTIKHQEQ